MTGENTEAGAVEDLFQKTKEYVNTRVELLRLKSISKLAGVFSSLITVILLLLAGLITLILLSVGLSLYLGRLLGALHYGFFIVGGIYLLLLLVILIFKKNIINQPLSNWMIKTLAD